MMLRVREVLIESLSRIKDNDVAVLLSSGIDSSSVLFALLELGKKVTAYTFSLDDRMSTDFVHARKNCKEFGCEFIPIFLPLSIAILIRDVRFLINDLGLRKKTKIECMWPMLYTIKSVSEDIIITGACADGHFGISRDAMINYRHSVVSLDKFRRKLFSDRDYAQVHTVGLYAASFGKSVIAPYYSQAMQDVFLGTEWNEINRPNQKQPILDAFPEEFARIRIFKHTNLQLGDSGISEHFGKLLQTDLNSKGYKSVVGIYNSIARGEV